METQHLGPYELIACVGTGGMGQVFRALHRPLNRVVALKVLKTLVATPADRQRFVREMQLAASLSNPALVRVYDGGTIDEVDFLAMELFTGRSLAQMVAEDGALDWRFALAVGSRVADGLASLHQSGILHRDIKPSNVMVEEGGAPKLLDFGIARRLDATRLTETGEMVGTMGYLAPTILTGAEASAETDLWSLGATIYTTLVAAPPYPAPDLATWVRRAVSGEFTLPHEVDDRIPVEASRFLGRLIGGTQVGAFTSAAELRDALQQILKERARQTVDEALAGPVFAGARSRKRAGAARPSAGPSTERFAAEAPRASAPRTSLSALRGGLLARAIAAFVLAALVALVALCVRAVRPVPGLVTAPPFTALTPARPTATPERYLRAAGSVQPLVLRILAMGRAKGKAAERQQLDIARQLAREHFSRSGLDISECLEQIPGWLADPARDPVQWRALWDSISALSALDAAGEVIAGEPVVDVTGVRSRYAPFERDRPAAPGAHRPILGLTEPALKSLAVRGELPLMSHRLHTGLAGLGFFAAEYLDVVDALAVKDAADPMHREGMWLKAGTLPPLPRGAPVRVVVRVSNLSPEFCLRVRLGGAPELWFRNRRADFRGFVSPGYLQTSTSHETKGSLMSLTLPAGFPLPAAGEVQVRLECMSVDGSREPAPQMGFLSELALESPPAAAR